MEIESGGFYIAFSHLASRSFRTSVRNGTRRSSPFSLVYPLPSSTETKTKPNQTKPEREVEQAEERSLPSPLFPTCPLLLLCLPLSIPMPAAELHWNPRARLRRVLTRRDGPEARAPAQGARIQARVSSFHQGRPREATQGLPFLQLSSSVLLLPRRSPARVCSLFFS